LDTGLSKPVAVLLPNVEVMPVFILEISRNGAVVGFDFGMSSNASSLELGSVEVGPDFRGDNTEMLTSGTIVLFVVEVGSVDAVSLSSVAEFCRTA
jgi:hypothetical protein